MTSYYDNLSNYLLTCTPFQLGVGLAVFIIGWILCTCISIVLSKGEKQLSLGSKLWAIVGYDKSRTHFAMILSIENGILEEGP